MNKLELLAKLRPEVVEDNGFYFKPLTVGEFNRLNASDLADDEKTLAMLQYSLCDESGTRLLDDEDRPALNEMALSQLNKLIESMLRVSGVTRDAKKN